ncbi:uncharacterized protein SCDLUD_004134 [Saccharomycodes ludwigii]|uniref:uncharacterized protein n=1 Tax=Saccharomycodes ludwigii TaxID=36035 RepID=UPI001E871D76|nr:hypothetical protein SCDLUD_004134 [Saccharomycodes ludwigii]KAH3899838.1 hypothetical protein SCDLUD_004134 [Saccharomycodes ludwigii]
MLDQELVFKNYEADYGCAGTKPSLKGKLQEYSVDKLDITMQTQFHYCKLEHGTVSQEQPNNYYYHTHNNSNKMEKDDEDDNEDVIVDLSTGSLKPVNLKNYNRMNSMIDDFMDTRLS